MDKQLQNDLAIVESLLEDAEPSDRQSFQHIKQRIAELEQAAQRYQRLRVLGAAPAESSMLANGTVLRFTSLDDYVDADIAVHPSRGEY